MVKDVSANVNKNELFIVSESPLHGAHFYLSHIALYLYKQKKLEIVKNT